MFLIWKGYGWLVPVQVIVSMCTVQVGTDLLFGKGYYTEHDWVKGLAVGLTSGGLFPVGWKLNKTDPSDSKVSAWKGSRGIPHTFFFVPYQHWAWLTAALFIFAARTE